MRPPDHAPTDPDETTLMPLPSVLSAGGRARDDDTPVHDHPGDELVFLERGACTVEAEGATLALTGPGLLLVPRGVRHDQRNRPGNISWFCVYRSRRHQLGGPARTLALLADDPLAEWFTACCRHYLAPGSTPTAVAALLLAILERIAVLDQAARAPALPQPVSGALRHIERHLAEELDADRLAAVAGVSPGHLRTLFRRHLGASPQAVHRARRLELAAKLLRGSYLRVGEVAAACGWADADYFARLFTRRYRQSPRDWRQRNRG